jgi:hypothetical protein
MEPRLILIMQQAQQLFQLPAVQVDTVQATLLARAAQEQL